MASRSNDLQTSEAGLGDARLLFFIQDRLGPTLEVLTAAPLPTEIRWYVHAELLEAFFWLQRGVEIQFFPLATARRLVYEYFPSFLKAVKDVNDSPFFDTWFSPALRASLSSQFSGRINLFSDGRTEGTQTEAHHVFQSHMILSNGFVQREESRGFIQALTLTSEDTWRKSLSTNEQVPFFGGPKTSEQPIAHWVFPGFFAELEFMLAVRQLKITFSDSADAESEGLKEFRRGLRDIQQWRLNFADYAYRSKFMMTAKLVSEIDFPEAAASEESIGPPSGQFLREVEELASDWGFPRAKSAGERN